MDKIFFSKYSGAGNDFVIFDNRGESFPLKKNKLIPSLCDRHNGIGADGVILLQNSSKADYKILIFNSDGSVAEMCGNGLRCFIKYLSDSDLVQPEYLIESLAGLHHCYIKGDEVHVQISAPKQIELKLKLKEGLIGHQINTGIPHTVLFYDSVNSLDVNSLGKEISHHSRFIPSGTNVNFVRITENKTLEIRTYERGVGGETQACGTGATASALIASLCHALPSPITLKTKSGLPLKISFKKTKESFENVYLSGPAKRTFTGSLNINEL